MDYHANAMYINYTAVGYFMKTATNVCSLLRTRRTKTTLRNRSDSTENEFAMVRSFRYYMNPQSFHWGRIHKCGGPVH